MCSLRVPLWHPSFTRSFKLGRPAKTRATNRYMRILGISAFYHDSAAALVVDGHIVAAAQEERFTRKKHDSSYPENASAYCLSEGKLSLADVDFVAFYDKPFLKFERLLETYLAFAPRGFKSFSLAVPIWLKEKLFQKELLKRRLKQQCPEFDWEQRLLFTEHHQAHAASAFFPSPFNDAAVLTMDGVGEWATTSVGHGHDNRLDMTEEIHFPHSLGLLYSAFTYYTGFKVNSGEYKVMGLAPYGEPKYKSKILDNLIDLKEDGSFRLNLDYFDYCTGLRMTNSRFDALFDGPPRDPASLLAQRHMDLAASIQAVTEEIVSRLAQSIAKESGARNLCLAGGVALNCVANGKIQADKFFEQIWIQPAVGDAGGALGAALAAFHLYQGRPRQVTSNPDAMLGAYLGPEYCDEEISPGSKQPKHSSKHWTMKRLLIGSPKLSRMAKPWDGFRDVWNLDQGRLAHAQSLATLVHRQCRRHSI